MPTTVTMIRSKKDGRLLPVVLGGSPHAEYVEFFPLYRLYWTTPDYTTQ